jgi:hypothetical protein
VYDNTSSWDVVQHEPSGTTGYEESLTYEVICLIIADCDCTQDSESPTGWRCFTDLTTYTELFDVTVRELNTDVPCVEEE